MRTEEQRGGPITTAAEEAAGVMAAIERVKASRERRAMSVPCGLIDAAHCNDGEETETGQRFCPLRDEDDCPARIDRERLAAERAAASRSASAPRDKAIAMGLPKLLRQELGLEPGIPALELGLNDALRATRGPQLGILVLAGPTGTGKSLAAAEWCWKRGGLWRTAGELARMPWYGRESEVGQLETTPALVIDDLGVQADVGNAGVVFRARLGELVAKRFAEKLPTVLTTNATGDDLRRILDDRIKDRIKQDGVAIECVGASLRGQQQGLPGVEG